MSATQKGDTGDDGGGIEPWADLRIKVPASWKRELESLARARALTVSALVRQCIRSLMISRHRDED